MDSSQNSINDKYVEYRMGDGMTAQKHANALQKEMRRYERYMKEISLELEIEKNKERKRLQTN